MTRIPLIITLLAFGALTAVALAHHGYFGIFALHFKTWAGMQVLTDLVIALALVMVWMWHDARERGISPYPFLVLTATLGSIGALFYLLRRELGATAVAAPRAATAASR